MTASTADASVGPATFEEFTQDRPRVDAVMNGVYTRGDRLMSWLIGLHCVFAVIFAAIYDTWLLSLVIAAAGAGMFFLSVHFLPRHRLTRVLAGVALQTFVALHIYQLHGLPEMHFFFFTGFTAMVVYEDGVAMWPGTILIIGQHIVFALLQNAGVNLYFFEDPYIGIRKLFFHFGIAILHVVLCGVWTHFLRRQALLEAFQRDRLQATQIEREQEMTARFEMDRARTRAEDAARAKGEFLATMSHEMRTPLNGILGMSDLLSRSTLAPQQSERLETLRTCADNLLALVNDVLDLSKIEAGGLEIETRTFDVRTMVDEVLAINAARALGKKVELFAVVERSVPDSLVGDETRVRQALTNLVANAVKFTSSGEVEIRVRPAEAGAEGEGSTPITFSVRDTGIGIDEATRSRLFAPFTQADSSIGRRFGGSGLGLAISKRLVEAMGGTIGFESTPGRGSYFFFTLPCKVDEAAARPSFFAERSALVVADHGGTRAVVVELLASRGMRVAEAGREAPAKPEADVVVVDAAVGASTIEALARQYVGGRLVVLSRGAEPAARPGPSVTWPFRSVSVEGAVAQALNPGAPVHVVGDRGLAWRPPPGKRVLVVEDNPVNQVVAEAMLKDLGIDVILADDGVQALAMLERQRFDLVLMDCQMPTLDGFETTRRLRAKEAGGARTPVVALTAQAMAGDEDRCRDAGMDDYMAKPIERRRMIERLQRFLGDGPARAPSATAAKAPAPVVQASDAQGGDRRDIESFLTTFAADVGAGPVDKLIAAFTRSVPEQLTALRRPGADAGARKRAAHSLKGATRTVGLVALADRIAELEEAIGRATASAPALSSEIDLRLRAVCKLLATRQATRAPAMGGVA